MTPLWLLMRWAAEVVVNGQVKNEWFYDIPAPARDYLFEVGQNILTLFG